VAFEKEETVDCLTQAALDALQNRCKCTIFEITINDAMCINARFNRIRQELETTM
jgi:hypothetical protein